MQRYSQNTLAGGPALAEGADMADTTSNISSVCVPPTVQKEGGTRKPLCSIPAGEVNHGMTSLCPKPLQEPNEDCTMNSCFQFFGKSADDRWLVVEIGIYRDMSVQLFCV